MSPREPAMQLISRVIPVLVGVLVLLACESGDRPQPVNDSSGTETSKTATATRNTTDPNARRTGIAGIDAVIDAVLSRDIDRIDRLVEATQRPCRPDGPPFCPLGAADRTLVDAF